MVAQNKNINFFLLLHRDASSEWLVNHHFSLFSPVSESHKVQAMCVLTFFHYYMQHTAKMTKHCTSYIELNFRVSPNLSKHHNFENKGAKTKQEKEADIDKWQWNEGEMACSWSKKGDLTLSEHFRVAGGGSLWRVASSLLPHLWEKSKLITEMFTE